MGLLIENVYSFIMVVHLLLTLLLPITFVATVVLLFRVYRDGKVIRTLKYNLRNQMNNEKVVEYIKAINKINIPNSIVKRELKCLTIGRK